MKRMFKDTYRKFILREFFKWINSKASEEEIQTTMTLLTQVVAQKENSELKSQEKDKPRIGFANYYKSKQEDDSTDSGKILK